MFGGGLDSPTHIALLVVALLLVFGAKRLPEIGRSLGSGIREFKQSVTGESHAATELPVAPGPASPPVSEPVPVAGVAAAGTPAVEQQQSTDRAA